MRGVKSVVLAVGFLVTLPLAAHAQAGLAGLVRDTSGAVLPGVTVEASSPVLIEKVRSATTDASGRYSLADLRPGTYRVAFTLPGFKTVVRDGVEVSGTAVFSVNADLAVGAVEETITVTGETPVVNLQSTTRQAVMDQEVVTAIPSSRTPFTTGVLIPGVKRGAFMSQDVGGSVVQEVASLEANGGRTADQRLMVNGVALSSMIGGGWGGGAVPNATGTSEFAIDVSAVDAQAATGGVRINFIPRDGGNRFSGKIFASYAGEDFASDNFTGSDVQERNPAFVPGRIKANGDFNPGFGGPFKRDKLWFFISARALFADNFVPGMFFNENVNQLNNYQYKRSANQAVLHQEQKIVQGRFTWQINPKNKLGVTTDFESFCACTTGITATTAPEAGVDRRFPLQRFVTADWNTPVSSKLLVEASAIHRVERWGGMHPQEGKLGNVDGLTPGIVGILDNPNPVTGASLSYRANTGAGAYNNSWNWNIHYRAAVSYITGSHNFKVGFNNAYGHYENTNYSSPSAPYYYSFANGIPTSINYRLLPRTVAVNVNRDLGLFAQDKWTTGRWTLSGGVRYDTYKNSFPPQSIAGTYFGRSLNISYDTIDNASWHDITPKLGATYDVFGNGKTAFKITLNKYLEGLGTTGAISDTPNPINRLLATTNRTWSDTTGLGINGDFVPQCDLNNFAANGECGALANAAIFGTVVPGTNFDPDMLEGWGKRGFNWEFTTSIQQEIVPRLSAELQYARRWYGNFRTQDDLSVAPTDYTRFTFPTPADSRLPDGGNYTLTGFDLTPAGAATAQSNFVTLSKNYGTQTEHFDGLNFSVNARLQNGLLIQGGFGTGKVVTDDCEIVEKLPDTLHQFLGNNTRTFVFAARPLEECHRNNGWRTQLQGLAAYTIPKIDVQVSGTFQNLPGVNAVGNYNNPSTGTLGRPFSGPAGALPFRAFSIVQPGELYVERLNQIDMRVSKIFRMASTRTNLNFDFYNMLNGNSVIGENQTYAPAPSTAWRSPTVILLARMFKISADFEF
jgi:hypothetical protein